MVALVLATMPLRGAGLTWSMANNLASLVTILEMDLWGLRDYQTGIEQVAW